MSGDLKSGIPADVEIPAPVMTTILLGRSELMNFATPERVRSVRVCGGVLGSMGSWDSAWPILSLLDEALAFWWRFRCLRPMVAVLRD